jgi:hypothetical protein
MSQLQMRTTLHIPPVHPELAAPQRKHAPIRRVSALTEGNRVRKRGLYLGTDPDGKPLYLHSKFLKTHLHLIGPTGQGKSLFIL